MYEGRWLREDREYSEEGMDSVATSEITSLT